MTPTLALESMGLVNRLSSLHQRRQLAMIEFRFLGGTTVSRDGEPLSGPASRRHPLALLALLSIAPSLTLSREKAIGLLWPDVDEGIGRNRLTSILHPLRRALGSQTLNSVGSAIRLDAQSVDCDVWLFRSHLARADANAAVASYHGTFLDGFFLEGSSLFNERIDVERQRLHRQWWEAVQSLAEGAEEAARLREASHWWQTLAAEDPLDSSIAMRLLRCLAAAGSHREALRAGQIHRECLRQELDIEPDAEFLELLDRLRSTSLVRHSPIATADQRPGIAVLPFEMFGNGEPGLGEGIHSGILTRLSALDSLSVISRTSVRVYRDSSKRPVEIARELGVEWVLEGDVQFNNARFRVNIRLIRTPQESSHWAQAYEGELNAADFFQTQADLAAQIADQVLAELTPRDRQRLAENPTDSLEAYRLCTEGRMYLDGRTPESMHRALACFEEALAIDESYAVAWVGVGDSLGLLHAYGHLGKEVLPRAAAAIDKALDCDDGCAEAHAALGRLLGQHNRAPESLDELRRAVALSPGYAEAHNWMSVGLYVSGDAEAALASAQRAVTLNPLSAEAVSNLGTCHLFMGNFELALRETRRSRELGGDYQSAAFYEAHTLYELGQYREADAILARLTIPWVGSGVYSSRAVILAAQGLHSDAAALLDPIRAAGHSFDEALVLAALGECEAALECFACTRLGGLEMAVSYWPSVAVRYLFSRLWDPLRKDHRYLTLRRYIDEIYGLI